MTMRFNFLKLLGRILVRERSALNDPYCQFAWGSVGMYVISFIRRWDAITSFLMTSRLCQHYVVI